MGLSHFLPPPLSIGTMVVEPRSFTAAFSFLSSSQHTHIFSQSNHFTLTLSLNRLLLHSLISTIAHTFSSHTHLQFPCCTLPLSLVYCTSLLLPLSPHCWVGLWSPVAQGLLSLSLIPHLPARGTDAYTHSRTPFSPLLPYAFLYRRLVHPLCTVPRRCARASLLVTGTSLSAGTHARCICRLRRSISYRILVSRVFFSCAMFFFFFFFSLYRGGMRLSFHRCALSIFCTLLLCTTLLPSSRCALLFAAALLHCAHCCDISLFHCVADGTSTAPPFYTRAWDLSFWEHISPLLYVLLCLPTHITVWTTCLLSTPLSYLVLPTMCPSATVSTCPHHCTLSLPTHAW